MNIEGYGNPTVGVGHLVIGNKELKYWCDKGELSSEDISNLLSDDLKPRMIQLNNILPKNIQIKQCQYDALLSIIFNRGIGCESCGNNRKGKGFKGSNLYKDFIKSGNLNSENISEFIENDGSLLSGSDRREKEAKMYLNCK